ERRIGGVICESWTEPKVDAELRKPAAAQNPVTKDWIHNGSNATAIKHECREFPTLSCSSGGNRRGGIHEDHLEEKQGKRRSVVTNPLQQEALVAEQAEGLAEQV